MNIANKIIPVLFEEQVKETPQNIAIVSEKEQLTYQELNQRANQVAHYLRRAGVTKESIVALHLRRSLQAVVSIIAVLKAGGAYLPLDYSEPPQRLESIIEESKACALITASQAEAEKFALGKCDVIIFDEFLSEFAEQPKNNLLPITDLHSLAYIIYTSGSTGKPKGVEIEYRGIANLIYSQIDLFQMNADSRELQFSSLNFDAHVFEVWTALLCGASLYIPSDELRADPVGLADYIQLNKITTITLPPVILTQMPRRPHTSLITLVAAGDVCPKEVLDYWRIRCRVINAYGPTEATVCTSMFVYDGSSNRCIGLPIDNVFYYVLDAQQQKVKIGEVGELYVGGIGVARGYKSKPKLTEQRFILRSDDSDSSVKQRLYKTGDLVKPLANGNFEYVGRVDFQLKFNGVRIEPEGIESLLSQHLYIQNAIVALKTNKDFSYLVAYVRPKLNKKLSASVIRAYLLEYLPPSKVPNAYVFLDEFPLLTNGKVDRAALPLPQFQSQEHSELSLTSDEEELREIWAGLLNVDKDVINSNTDFFGLGGNSMRATILALSIEEKKKVTIKASDILENSTLRALAIHLHNLSKNEHDALCTQSHNSLMPLSFAQRRLWLAYKMLETHCPQAYNIQLTIEIEGVLSLEVLQKSLQGVVNRHEILRTCFPEAGLQEIGNFSIQLEHHVVSKDSRENVESVQRIIDQVGNHDFGDLTRLPLMRAVLIEKNTQHFLLSIVFCHIVIDAMSVPIFLQDLCHIYNQNFQQKKLSLPALPVQYADFALWQHKRLTDGCYKNDFKYWKQQLDGASGMLNLPIDKARPSRPSYCGKAHVFYLSNELTSNLQKLAQEKAVSFFSLLFSSFAVLLYRYCQQEDIVLGAVCLERSHHSLNRLIGFFMNVLPIRIQQNNKLGFLEVMQEIHQTLLQAYKHNAPLEEIIDQLKLPHHPNYHPLFQVTVTMRDSLDLAVNLTGLGAKLRDESLITAGNMHTAKFDLEVEFEMVADKRLGIKIEYATDIFTQETVSKMSEHWAMLCEGIVQNPNASITALPLLSGAEKKDLLAQCGDTYKKYFHKDETIVSLFQEQVLQRPFDIAVVDGNRSLSYRDLDIRSNQLAHYLQACEDFSSEERIVAVALQGSIEFIVSILAIIKIGAVYLPLDPEIPARRLQFMLSDSQATIVITTSSCAEKINRPDVQYVCIDQPETKNQLLEQPGDSSSFKGISPNQLAYVIYTSGSTGKPKGVMIEHKSVVQLVNNVDYIDLSSDDVIAQVCNVTFDVSGFEIWGGLLNGAKVVVYSKATVLDTVEFRTTLIKQGVTVLVLPTMLFYRFLSLDIKMFSSIKWLLFIGEKLMSTDVLRKLFNDFSTAPQNVVNVYGPTEDTIFSTSYKINPFQLIGDDVPIGRPIAGTVTYILDEQQQPVPAGVLGELYLGGCGLARGYLNRENLTKEKFIKNPFVNNGGLLYRTGDLVRCQTNGEIVFVRRVDNQIKMSGFRVELIGIEEVLLSQAEIKEAVVVSYEQQGRQLLIAYVSLNKSVKDSRQYKKELRLALRDVLPQYMIPADFVILPALPLSINGKIDRKHLPKPSLDLSSEYVAPNTIMEKKLVKLWEKALSLGKKISINDNFFMIGGNSLLAMQLTNNINKQFGYISYSDLFTRPTIQSQAALLQTPEQQRITPVLTIDYFRQQACLDADISLNGAVLREYPKNPQSILLTGATGFLGIFILDQLLQTTSADVYCLIRGRDMAHAQQRIVEGLRQYKLSDYGQYSPRIKLVVGDLRKVKFGLSDKEYTSLANKIEIIYHVAAEVSFIKPYSALRDTNVSGVKNMLRFAIDEAVKPIHYASSVSVFSFAHYFKRVSLLNEQDVDWDESFSLSLPHDLGYMQTKAVAEKLMCEAIDRGIPVSIHRLGFMLCHSKTGIGNTNQLWAKFIRDCLAMGYYPDLADFKAELVTVDYASQLLVSISKQESSLGKIFHIVPAPEHNITTSTLFSMLARCGYPLKSESFQCWSNRLNNYVKITDDSALSLLLPLFVDSVQDGLSLFELYQYSPHFSVKNVESVLLSSSVIDCSINDAILKRYLAYLIEELPFGANGLIANAM